MTGTEVDTMVEAANAAAWEKRCEVTMEEIAKGTAAIDLLKNAVQLLEQVETLICDAADKLDTLPGAYTVGSLEIDAQELEMNVRTEIERMRWNE